MSGIAWDPHGIHKQMSTVPAVNIPQDLVGGLDNYITL